MTLQQLPLPATHAHAHTHTRTHLPTYLPKPDDVLVCRGAPAVTCVGLEHRDIKDRASARVHLPGHIKIHINIHMQRRPTPQALARSSGAPTEMGRSMQCHVGLRPAAPHATPLAPLACEAPRSCQYLTRTLLQPRSKGQRRVLSCRTNTYRDRFAARLQLNKCT